MPDRVVIRCPGCDQKLGLKPELLGRQVKCPRCSAVLTTRTPAESKSPTSSGGSRRRKSASSEGRRATSSSQRSGNRSAPKRSPDLDPFHDDLEESLLEEEGDDNNWLDGIDDDDYGGEMELPGSRPPQKKRKRKKKSPQPQPKAGKKKRRTNAAPGNPLVWVGSGLVAGLISIVLTIGVSYTGISFLLLIAGIVSAGLIGGGIRSAAGSTDGWGPGLLAVAILLPSIFVGRIGAFYVNPALMGFTSGESSLTTEEEIQRYATDEAMIAEIIDDAVAFDHQWLNANGLDDDSLYSDAYWESDEEWLLPFEEQYNPLVWAEGERRWERFSESERADRIQSRKQEIRKDAGLFSEEEINQLIADATSDEGMTEQLAEELQSDDEWLAEAGLTENAVWNHVPPDDAADSVEAQYHPTVWAAAAERWEAMDDGQKAEMKRLAREELSTVAEVVEDTLFIIVAVGATLYSMLMPFRYIGCTITAIALAFKTASNLGAADDSCR